MQHLASKKKENSSRMDQSKQDLPQVGSHIHSLMYTGSNEAIGVKESEGLIPYQRLDSVCKTSGCRESRL